MITWLSLKGGITLARNPDLMMCLCLNQVAHFKDFIPKAFPGGHSMILDAEVLLIDNKTAKPLPFGTLGVHKVRGFNLSLPRNGQNDPTHCKAG